MLKQRIITACILLLILLGAVLVLPAAGFQIFIGAVLALAAWEWSRLSGITHPGLHAVYVGLFLVLLYFSRIQQDAASWLIPAGTLWWLLALVLIKLYPQGTEAWHRTPLLLAMGFAVLLPSWLALIYLRDSPAFRQYMFVFVAMVAAADTGAYFSGKRFGRHKLSPNVSPNKTWEGFAGGILACCAVFWLGVAATDLVNVGSSLLTVVIATAGAALLAGYSVIGDLFESMMKRQANMKDSGTLLPGHGGVLDRIDSMTAALPLYTWGLMAAGLI